MEEVKALIGKKIRLRRNGWVCKLGKDGHQCMLYHRKGQCYTITSYLSTCKLKIEAKGIEFLLELQDMHLFDILETPR